MSNAESTHPAPIHDRRSLLLGLVGAAASASIGCSHAAAPSAHAAAPPAKGALSMAFVISKDAEVLDFCGPLEVFANASTPDGSPLFAPYMVADDLSPVRVIGGMRVVPDHAFASAPQPKIIVIPAQSEPSTAMLDWIREASRGAELTMSVCNGAFVLAKTGLLDGKSATAHHGGYFRFAATFPNVLLRRGARFVEEGRLATAGGVSSGIDLALRVVERYAGKQQAADIADIMEYQSEGWLKADSNEAYAKMPPFDDARPLCPVCFMLGDRSISTVYKDKTYYFCALEEKQFFTAHTDVFERFLSEDMRPSTRMAD